MQEVNPQPLQPIQNSHFAPKNLLFLLFFALILIVLTVSATYFVLQSRQIPQTPAQLIVIPTHILSNQPYPSVSNSDETANWKTYTNIDYKFSLKYPNSYKLYENEEVSVDNVRTPKPNVVSIVSNTIPTINSNFVMTISTKNSRYSNIDDEVNNNDWCNYITSQKGKSIFLNNLKALLFENTPCGSFGSTVIYTFKNNVVYLIKIESPASYSSIKEVTDSILSTFKFLDQNENAATSQKCGLCGPQGIHNVNGSTCAQGLICKNGMKTSLSYCVAVSEPTDICEK